jgi:hypothetical protein
MKGGELWLSVVSGNLETWKPGKLDTWKVVRNRKFKQCFYRVWIEGVLHHHVQILSVYPSITCISFRKPCIGNISKTIQPID